MTVERIVKNLADVKVLIGQSLDILEQKLTDEYRRLYDIQAAIKIESDNLEEIHEIKKNADSLTALLLAQKEYKTKFDAEMDARKMAFNLEIDEKKKSWVRENERIALEQKEHDELVKKEREREEDEYKYSLKIARKKDRDEYEAKKQDLERELAEQKEAVYKDLSEREAFIKSQEDELVQLRNQVGQFPVELEKAIKKTEQETKDRIENMYQHQIDLEKKENEGQQKLTQQIIDSLQAKIKEQESFIKQLTQKTDAASNQAQTIALKALESSSKIRFYGSCEDSKKSNQTNV